MDVDPLFVYFVHDGIYGSDLTYLMYEHIFTYIYIYIFGLVVSLFTSVYFMYLLYILWNVCEMPVQNIVSICIS